MVYQDEVHSIGPELTSINRALPGGFQVELQDTTSRDNLTATPHVGSAHD